MTSYTEVANNTESFQTALKNNQVAVASTDASGMILEANQAFCDLVGFSLSELQNKAYQDITPERWVVFENNMVIKKVFVHGFAQYQKEFRHANTTTIPIEIQVRLLKNERDENIGMWAKVWPVEELSRTFEFAVNG